MGRKPTQLQLSKEQQSALERYYETSSDPFFSRRCHGVLLKTKGLSNAKIAELLMVTPLSVQNWVRAYRQGGIELLKPQPGRRRPPRLNCQQNKSLIEQAVKKDRQRLSQACELIAEQTGQKISVRTLQRVLKKITGVTGESD